MAARIAFLASAQILGQDRAGGSGPPFDSASADYSSPKGMWVGKLGPRETTEAYGRIWGRYPSTRRDSGGRYFAGSIKGRKTYLHRYVWEQVIGPIPEGIHIHHIDGDVTNNDIANLAAVTLSGHMRLHRFENLLTTE